MHKWHFFFGWEDHFNNLPDGPNNFSPYISKFVLLTFGLLELTKLLIFIYVNCNWRFVVSSTYLFFSLSRNFLLTKKRMSSLLREPPKTNYYYYYYYYYLTFADFLTSHHQTNIDHKKNPNEYYWWKNQLMYKAKSQQSLKTQKRENCTTAKHMNPIFLFYLFIHFMFCFWIKICFSKSKCRGDYGSLME